MLFHYVSGALVCQIAIEGLTAQHKPRRFDWLHRDGSSPANPDEYCPYYGGYRYFVCESLSRETARRIVTALGGYLVDDSYINVGRQLGDGGPFFMHQFNLYSPRSLGRVNSIENAAGFIQSEGRMAGLYRIYDASGYMVMEIKRDRAD